jgi:hypothetical protein
LQAELLKTIDASTAKVGDEVTLKTIQPLEFDGAKYPAEAILSGHVTQVDASHLSLMFDHIAVIEEEFSGAVGSFASSGDDAARLRRGRRGIKSRRERRVLEIPAWIPEFKIHAAEEICFGVRRLPSSIRRSACLRGRAPRKQETAA